MSNNPHEEKQSIFDEYAKKYRVNSFEELLKWSAVKNKTAMEHIFSACDMVQKEQQKRIKKSIDKLECPVLHPDNLIN